MELAAFLEKYGDYMSSDPDLRGVGEKLEELLSRRRLDAEEAAREHRRRERRRSPHSRK